MRILSIPTTYGLSRPVNGGQNRFQNLTKALTDEGHVVVAIESLQLVDPADVAMAKIYVYPDLQSRNRTLTIFRDLNPFFLLTVFRIIRRERIDLVQITHPAGILTVWLTLRIMRKRTPIVYDAYDVSYDFLKENLLNNPNYNWFERKAAISLVGLLERVSCRHLVDHITSVSEKDRKAFGGAYKLDPNKITVIPSGSPFVEAIDFEDRASLRKDLGVAENGSLVVFHGSFSHPPNRIAFSLIEERIAPLLERKNRNAKILLAGSGLERFVRSNIISVGFVPHLYRLLSAADVAIVPLTSGSGTKLKVLDYMALGLPIVTTKKGAEGLNIRNGDQAIIVDDVNEDFVEAISDLLEHPEKRNRIGSSARRVAREEYSWAGIGAKLSRLFEQLCITEKIRTE